MFDDQSIILWHKFCKLPPDSVDVIVQCRDPSRLVVTQARETDRQRVVAQVGEQMDADMGMKPKPALASTS